MNAVIIGVGNQKHQARFEECRDYIRQELTEVGASLAAFHLVPPRTGEVLDRLRESTRSAELLLVLSAPDPAAAGAVTGAVCQGLRLEREVDVDLARRLARRADQHRKDWNRAQIESFAAAPVGAEPIPNPTGMVQGYALKAAHQLLLVLPAVQSELTACFGSAVMGLLAERSDGVTARRTLRAAELGEAPVSALLEGYTRAENPRVVLYDHGGECIINITAAGRTLTEAKNICDRAARQITEKLGPLLTSAQGEPLAQQVARRLSAARLTLAVAEFGTDGALAAAVRSGTGKDSGEKVLAGGMNLVSESQMTERLGVSRKLLAEFGEASRRTAAAMAVLVRRAARSGLGAAITCGDPDRSGKGTMAYIAITDGRQVWAKRLSFLPGTSPETVGNIASLQALNMLRLYIRRFPDLLPGGSAVEHAAPGLMTGMEKLSAGLAWRLAKIKGAMGLLARGDDDQEENRNGEGEAMEMNLLQRIIHKKLTKGDGLRLGILGVSLAVFVGCVIYIGSVYAESHKNKGIIQDLQSIYGDSNIRPEDVEGYPENYLPKFAALYAVNEDIAGWIRIEDTKYINMPVVQYYNNEYYERLDFNRQSNQHGVAFVDYRVAQIEPSTNTIIYAHNMNDGQMFGELLGYKSVEYYRTHPLVQYDSVYYEGMWKIFGVVICQKDDPDFLYHSFIDPKNDQDMVDFVTKIRERSILNTKVDVRTDDHLLTLSTCDYSFHNAQGDHVARFVVFARKVRDGESLEVDTAGATINTNPVMPAEWYADLQRKQEAELKRQQEEAAAAAANKWLTEEEQRTLSAEEAQKLAEQREKDAQEYLSYDERESGELDLLDMLMRIERRKAEFKLFLDRDEQRYSLSERLRLVEERRDEARAAGLTDEELEEAGNWAAIRELIESSGTAALDNFIKQNRLYLTPNDRSVGSLAKLEELRNQRRNAMRLEADQLGLDLSKYTTYEQYQEAVKAAKGGASSSSASSVPESSSESSSSAAPSSSSAAPSSSSTAPSSSSTAPSSSSAAPSSSSAAPSSSSAAPSSSSSAENSSSEDTETAPSEDSSENNEPSSEEPQGGNSEDQREDENSTADQPVAQATSAGGSSSDKIIRGTAPM